MFGWSMLEFLRGGRQGLGDFLRSVVFYSVLMELLPLPFAFVIANIFLAGEPGIFFMVAAGLVGTAMVVQRFADASRRLEFRSNDLAALNEFGQALSRTAFDIDKILELLYEHARRIVAPDVCHIGLIAPDQPNALTLAFEATRAGYRHPNELQSNNVWVEHFARDREPIRAIDLGKSFVQPYEGTGVARVLEQHIQIDGKPPRSALIVPMLAGDQLIGVLTFASAQSHMYFPIHARNLLSMCGQAAASIQNARLYVAEQKRATQLATISEVGRDVATLRDLDEFLQNVVARIRERFGYSNVHIFTVDRQTGYAVFRASTHPNSGAWRERQVQLRIGLEGIVGWVAATQEALVVPDVQNDKRFVLDPDKSLIDTRSEVAVPLIGGSQMLGVLDVQSNQVNAFDDDDLFILKTLGAQVAVALEDARLYQSQREEAYYLNVLLQVAENLSESTNLEESLETVVRITPLLVGVARCALFLYRAEEKVFLPAQEYGLSREQQAAFRNLRIPSDNGLAFDILVREQKPLVIEDAMNSHLVEREYLDTFDLRSMVIVPMISRGKVVGAIIVDQGSRPTRFTQHETDVVMGIANQAAAAIEGARLTQEAEQSRRLDYELSLARKIQENFLPDGCPVIPGYDICSWWDAAREVGGDFYDFIALPGQRTAMLIADVSDKGIAAALFMALSRTILRTMTIGKPSPREAVERANDVIITDARSDMFVTVFHAALDPHTHRLTYVNAGHNPPLLYRAASDEVVLLKGRGLAMGVLPNITYDEHAIDFAPGDVLLMYTDGLTDAINPGEEEFGMERLIDVFVNAARQNSSEIIDALKRAVYDFAGDGIHYDDVTMIVLKRN